MKQLATKDDIDFLSSEILLIKGRLESLESRISALEYTSIDFQRELARLTTPANTVSISSWTIWATPSTDTRTETVEYQPYDQIRYRFDANGNITIV